MLNSPGLTSPGPEESTYIDCYNRERYVSDNRAVLDSFQRPDSEFFGGDAMYIVELMKQWRYRIPGLPSPRSGVDEAGRQMPTNYFITTPNMLYIPNTLEDHFGVQARIDGRYAEADFTQCPQWYFQGTYYLPYIRKRPSKDFDTHPYRVLWYNIVSTDIIPEEGCAVQHMGRLRKDLVDEFTTLRKELATKIKDLETSGRFTHGEMTEMLYARQGMLFASVILACAPQPYNLLLLTVTGFQRYFLEALACYEYLTIYHDLPYREREDPNDESNDEPLPARPDIMGCFTSHLELAEQFYRKGVPVWLVRPPADIPADINIHVKARLGSFNIQTALMKNSQPVYEGHASAVRNRACQSLKLGNIVLGHSAYRPYAGDFNAQYIPNLQQVDLYSPAFNTPNSSSSSSSTPQLPPSSSNPLSASTTAASSTAATAGLGTTPLVPPPALRKVQQPFDVNKSKFLLTHSPYRPAVNMAWARALQSVDSKPLRIWDHSDLMILRGYPFPDPQVLINAAFGERGKMYLLAWLSIRSAWLLQSSSRTDSAPSAQEWKDYLFFTIARAIGLIRQAPGSADILEPPSKRRQKPLSALFGLNIYTLSGNGRIRWRNTTLSDGGRIAATAFQPQLLKEVVWDLYEHNFNFELLALDRVIHPRRYMSTFDGLNRDALVAACIPTGSFVSADIPTVHRGLGALRVENRWQYVEALRVVMLTWSGAAVGRLHTMQLTGPDAGRCAALEAIVFPFYCQQFFDYFGRAASVPHQLPL